MLLSLDSNILDENPAVYVRCTVVLAEALATRGELNEADRYLSALLESTLARLGKDNPLTIKVSRRLAKSWLDQDKIQQAQEHLESMVQPFSERQLKPMIKVVWQLVRVYMARGLFSDAEKKLHEAIKWVSKDHRDYNRFTIMFKNLLARIYIRKGEIAEAESLLNAMDISEGMGIREEASILSTRGHIQDAQGNYQEAIHLSEQALVLWKSYCETENDEYLIEETTLLQRRSEMNGFNEDIEQKYKEIIAKRGKLQGARHPTRVSLIADLAYAYTDKQRLTDAERLFHEVEELGGFDDQGENPLECATMIAKRANLYLSQRSWEQAEDCERRALRIRESHYPTDHLVVIKTKRNLASTLNSMERFEDAEGILRNVISDLVVQNPRPHHFQQIALSKRDLAGVLYNQYLITESLVMFEDALSAANAALAVKDSEEIMNLKYHLQKQISSLRQLSGRN